MLRHAQLASTAGQRIQQAVCRTGTPTEERPTDFLTSPSTPNGKSGIRVIFASTGNGELTEKPFGQCFGPAGSSGAARGTTKKHSEDQGHASLFRRTSDL